MRIIPEPIRTLPLRITIACGYLKEGAVAAKNKIASLCSDLCWKIGCKPWYDRNIKPLTKFDAILLSGALLLAATITVVAVKRFGRGALGLGMGAGVVVFLGACCISQHRVRKFHDAKAWKHVDAIRRLANDCSYIAPKFAEIEIRKNKLKKPQYNHLEQDLRALDENLREFKKVVFSSPLTEKSNAIMIKLHALYNNANATDEDKARLKKLEKVIDNLGTTAQNLTQLERKKNQLQDFNTQGIEDDLLELKKKIDKLIAVAHKPTLTDARTTFLKQVESLQIKLDPKKEIQQLPVPPDTQRAPPLPDDPAPANPVNPAPNAANPGQNGVPGNPAAPPNPDGAAIPPP